MTATLIPVPSPVPYRISRSRPSAATYRRRRAAVGTSLAVFTVLGLVAATDVLAGSGGDPASAAPSQPAHVRQSVIVQPGDTLWSIAVAHHGDAGLTDYLDTMVDINGGPTIVVGQSITLP